MRIRQRSSKENTLRHLHNWMLTTAFTRVRGYIDTQFTSLNFEIPYFSMIYKTRCISSYTYSYWKISRILMQWFHIDFAEVIHNLYFCTRFLECKLAFLLGGGEDVTPSRGCHLSQHPTSYARFVRRCAITPKRTNHTWHSIISARWARSFQSVLTYTNDFIARCFFYMARKLLAPVLWL